jgi:uncharacterized protein (TIGR02145 family)
LNRFSHIADEKRRKYAGMVSSIDDGVGSILDKLEEKNILDDTLIFFLTDNGGASSNASNNYPLRGFKSSFYEGGIRVPFTMSWPAVVPKGVTYDHPVSSMDMMATAVAEAGVTAENNLDGVNLIPYVTGEKEGIPHETLFWRNYDRNIYVVRDGDLKLIDDSGTKSIFNIADNPEEKESNKITFRDQEHGYLMELIEEWKSQLVPPAYLGLLQDQEYNQQNPDRFSIPNPYEADRTGMSIPEGYELIWSQEFNGGSVPDSNWWNYEYGFVRNQELQWYQPENVTISDGVLSFEGRRETVQNPDYDPSSDNWRLNRASADYTSASINTKDKFTFKYGVMEVRARIDTSKGSWPAIWTLGADRKWPDKGEVDVMEFYRRNNVPGILANAAWYGEDQGQVYWDGFFKPLSEFIWKMPDFPERFHVWRMEWNENTINLYLNDELLNTINVAEAEYSDGFNPLRQPHYILLNLALGSNGGDPSETDFPLSYEVDYVRVFQKKDDNNGPSSSDIIDIDGNGYKTVKIGDLNWMAENLRTTRFSNGDAIKLVSSNSDGNTEWKNTNQPARSTFRGNTELVESLGYLYNFYAVKDERGICMDRWRVPTEEDWMNLETYAGMPAADLNRDGWAGGIQNVGGKLKSVDSEHWESPNTGATDDYGFSWTGGRTRYAYGAFEAPESLYRFSSIWSADENNDGNAYRRLVRYNRNEIRRSVIPKKSGVSVRCVSDITAVSIEDKSSLPKTYELRQNYPNPFNPLTQIQFELPQPSQISLTVYDLLGRVSKELVNTNYAAGRHQIKFDGSNLASGIYLYQLKTDSKVITKRMTLLK